MDFLEAILAHKQREIARRRRARPASELENTPPPAPRDFAAALRKPGIALIAEIKRRSPSRGLLRENVDAADVARSYARNGAAALSVLTDHEFFGGSASDLRLAKQAIDLPVLQKDFTIDEYQIHEARQVGADAILLIMRILTDAQISRYLQLARALGLAALVEVHNETELAQAVRCNAGIIGVNNRNLDTFQVSLSTALHLKGGIPADCIAVAESGIHTRADVEQLEAAGYDALLVGEALMAAPDPGRKLAELLGATL